MSRMKLGSATQPDNSSEPELLDVTTVASILCCAPCTVRRLADSGRMPGPVRIGALVRWRRSEVQGWIEHGCQPSVHRGTNS